MESQAEGEGFEPPVGCPTAVLKTAAFVRSAIPPGASPFPKRNLTTARSLSAKGSSSDGSNLPQLIQTEPTPFAVGVELLGDG